MNWQTRLNPANYQFYLKPGLGSNFGNVGVRLKSPSSISPYTTRYDPNSPGRPDPNWSVDTSLFPYGKPTGNGGLREMNLFWNEWLRMHPETISNNNKWVIENLEGVAPKIDSTWLKYFPEHAGFKGDKILHHHVDQGPYAIPVPGKTHVGSGGPWHQ
jgi:hypothetical protein